MKITRDAFLYLDPKGDEDVFAQCATCEFFLREGDGACLLMSATDEVYADSSCGLYVYGDPKDSGEFLKAVTPDEAGLVRRQVRCENCASYSEKGCELFYDLNNRFPTTFDLDTNVNPQGCCNAQHPSSTEKAMKFNEGDRAQFRHSATHPSALIAKSREGIIVSARQVGDTEFVDIEFPGPTDEVEPHIAQGVNTTQIDKTADAPLPALDHAPLVDALLSGGLPAPVVKRGAKHSKNDQGLLDKAHDNVRDVVDGIHCADDVDEAAKASRFAKAGARHSKSTMDSIKKAHDALVGCGAKCAMVAKE